MDLQNRIRSWAGRVRHGALTRRLAPSRPGPKGGVRLAEWIAVQPTDSEADLIELPAPPDRSRRPAETVGPKYPLFEQLEGLVDVRASLVALIPGAQLVSDGLVVTPDNLVIADTAWDDERLATSEILNTPILPRPRKVRGRHASIISQWCSAYFHWVLDALPRIAILEQAGLGGLPLIVPSGLSSFQEVSLEMLDIGPDRLTRYESSLKPDVLVWPAPAGPTGRPPTWALRWLRERFAAGIAPKGRRLYISRSAAARRRVVNEPALVAALRAHEFEVVRAEELSFRDQVRLFAEAELVVAPHGAANTNLAFASQATLVEFFEPRYVNGCFYMLAGAAGHDYWYLMGALEGESDIRVPIAETIETVERAL
jgi:hypothetical protein